MFILYFLYSATQTRECFLWEKPETVDTIPSLTKPGVISKHLARTVIFCDRGIFNMCRPLAHGSSIFLSCEGVSECTIFRLTMVGRRLRQHHLQANGGGQKAAKTIPSSG